ncbi:MAG: endonuclease III [Candidatus Promineofilum sp.]|nr:endonuclease III [Promineifilum sp.]
MMTIAALRKKYAVVYRILNETYGLPVWTSTGSPLDVLVGTILSQATSDINSGRAMTELTTHYPDWESVMHAPPEEISDVIRSAGLANVKGPRIRNALRHIYRERGELSLDFLAGMPTAEAMDWLTSIEGVGPKTASIVLLFSMGRDAFPVDTHVHRVSGRLGLIPPRMSAEKAHAFLAELGAPETYYPIHINLIRHGREICHARGPLCHICPLKDWCDYYHQVVLPSVDS